MGCNCGKRQSSRITTARRNSSRRTTTPRVTTPQRSIVRSVRRSR